MAGKKYAFRDGKLVEVPQGGLPDRITTAGESLRTGPPTQNYLDNYARIFREGAIERAKKAARKIGK